MSIQEAVDLEKSPQLRRLFNPQILGRLPTTGRSRVRRTALGVIGWSSLLNCVRIYTFCMSQVPTPHGFPRILRPRASQLNQIYFLLLSLTLFLHWPILQCANLLERR
jgi:hypothetical protein